MRKERIAGSVLILMIVFVISSCASLFTEKITNTDTPIKKEYTVKRKGGVRHGTYTEYIDDFKMTEVKYKNGKREGKCTYFNKNGIVIKGNYKNDQREGEWKYYRNGKLEVTDVYSKGDMLKEKRVKHIKTEEPESVGSSGEEDVVFTIVQEMPVFNGGDVLSYLRKTTTYPAFSRDLGIQGTVWIEFVVNKFGEVTDAKVVKSPDGANDLVKESLRSVNALPRFSPAFQGGVPVSVRFTVPMNFKIK